MFELSGIKLSAGILYSKRALSSEGKLLLMISMLDYHPEPVSLCIVTVHCFIPVCAPGLALLVLGNVFPDFHLNWAFYLSCQPEIHSELKAIMETFGSPELFSVGFLLQIK